MLIDLHSLPTKVATPFFRLMKASNFLTPAIVYALAIGISFAVAAMIKLIDRSLQAVRSEKR